MGTEAKENRGDRKAYIFNIFTSGGFITINKTEALTAIDVNTGKFKSN